MNNFFVQPEIKDAKIQSLAFSIEVLGKHNTDSFQEFINKEVNICISKYSSIETKQINNIVGFNELHHNYGKKSRRIRSAPETLIKIVKSKGSIPRIIPLVDIYNIISIKYALALGAHDLDKITGNVELKFTEGGEKFIPIGTTELETIFPGEYAYFDDATNEIICRLEAKQSDVSKLTEESKRILFIIQGNSRTNKENLFSAKNELISNIKQYFDILVVNEYDYTVDN